MSALTDDQEELEVSDEDESEEGTGPDTGARTDSLHEATNPNVDSFGNVPLEVAAEPYFIVPPGFRFNTTFVGRKLELAKLDDLFQHREGQSSSILLHGPPGIGKTHLVRQFVFKNRKSYSGGVFWINSCSSEQIEQSFALIENVVSRNTNGDSPMVKTWFENRRDCLFIFDNMGTEVMLDPYIPHLGRDSNYIFTAQYGDIVIRSSRGRLDTSVVLSVGKSMQHFGCPEDSSKTGLFILIART